MDRAVRVGMVAYGIVHLTIAWLGIQLALGDHSGSASRNGALKQLAQQPFGEVVVWVVAIGMFLLVLWKLLEAFIDFTLEDGAKKALKPASNVFKAIVYGTLGVSAVRVATGSKSKSNTSDYTAKLMDQPFGRWLVGLVGLAIIGYGGYLVYRGWTEKFLKHLDPEGIATARYRVGTSDAVVVRPDGHVAARLVSGPGTTSETLLEAVDRTLGRAPSDVLAG
jgi:hypothetical protein